MVNTIEMLASIVAIVVVILYVSTYQNSRTTNRG